MIVSRLSQITMTRGYSPELVLWLGRRKMNHIMPELPEVETIRRGIEPLVVNRRVTSVLVRQPKLRWLVSPELGQALTGQMIQAVNRRGKYLLFTTGNGRMMIHLGMSGSLRILSSMTAAGKHDHVDIELDNGQMLRYRDPRRFGSIFWLEAGEGHDLIDKLGPEPLENEFDVEYLMTRSRGRKVPVKLFLMNSQIVVGIGNIYANEALFMAGIRPDRLAGSISKKRYSQLITAVKNVLSDAIIAGGTTLRDFVREDGSAGYFKQSLNVYGRGGLPCPICQRALREIRMGQRTTVFCTRCQR